MKRELFVASLDAIQKQMEYDSNVALKLSEAFPTAHEGNLLPQNDLLTNALIAVLEDAMQDTFKDNYGYTWIKYFCWELNFGEENYRLKVTENNAEVPMSNAGELWDYLKSKKNTKTESI